MSCSMKLNQKLQTTFRSLTLESEELEFNDGYTYLKAWANEDPKKAIEIVLSKALQFYKHN